MERILKLLGWPFSEDGRPWTIYVILLGALTTAAVLVLIFTDVGVTTTEVHRPSESGEALVLVERETETSIPVVSVITALLAGGWMVIPVRWFWDERAKRNDAAREEIRAKADHQRQVSLNMHERIHRYMEQYYAPDFYRMNRVMEWADKLKRELESGAMNKVTFYRLLYWLGRYHAHCIRFDDAGTPLIFRSHTGEREVGHTNWQLREFLSAGFGDIVEGDFLLARAVLPDREEHSDGSASIGGGKTLLDEVDFVDFLRRIDPTSGAEWDALRKVCGKLEEYFGKRDLLGELISKARKAQGNYIRYMNEVYKEWYQPEAATDGPEAPAAPARPGAR